MFVVAQRGPEVEDVGFRKVADRSEADVILAALINESVWSFDPLARREISLAGPGMI